MFIGSDPHCDFLSVFIRGLYTQYGLTTPKRGITKKNGLCIITSRREVSSLQLLFGVIGSHLRGSVFLAKPVALSKHFNGCMTNCLCV